MKEKVNRGSRILSTICLALILLFSVNVLVYAAEEETTPTPEPSDFTYTVSDERVYITGYTGVDEVIDIPETLETYPVYQINAGAFKENQTVRKIIIPESVKYIKAKAIESCPLLEEVVLNATLSDSYENMFYECANLKTLTIGSNVTKIWRYNTNIQYGMYLQEIYVEPENESYSSDNGILYNKDKTQFNLVPINYPAKEIIVNDNVESIYSYACAGNNNIEKLTIGNKVTDIAKQAFYACKNLKEVKLGTSLTSLDNSNVFQDCTALEYVYINSTLKYFSTGVFSGCENLSTIEFGPEVTAIPNERLKSVKQYIVDGTNENYCAVDGIMYTKDMKTLVSIPASIALEEYIIPQQVETVGKYAFEYNKNVKKVILGNSIVTLQNASIYKCEALEKIEFGNSLESIKSSAISECPNIKELKISGKNCAIESSAINDLSGLTYLELGKGIVTVENYAFSSRNDKLESVYVERDTKRLDESSLYNLESLSTLTVSEENENYCTVDSILYTKDMKQLLFCPVNINSEQIIIPDTVEVITERSMQYLTNVKSLICGSAVKEIQQRAFYKNSVLTNITLNDKVTTIEPYLFDSCKKLEQIILPENVETVNMSAFNDCVNLSEIVFYNPDAEIVSENSSGDYTIVGYTDSTAIKYAQENGFAYRELDEEDVNTFYVKNTSASQWDKETVQEIIPQGDVFAVNNASELAWLAQVVNDGTYSFEGKKVVLACDIDLNGATWRPIGYSHDRSFRGSFYGQDHTISNFLIDDQYSYQGLIGYWLSRVSGKELVIDRLHVTGVITGDSAERCGAIVGVAKYMAGAAEKITNCTSEGDLTINGTTGGIVGNVYGGRAKSQFTISDCKSYCEVSKGGGIVGALEAMGNASKASKMVVKDCEFRGNCKGGRYANNGGIVGQVWRSNGQCKMLIYRCANYGTITGSYSSCGGILSGTGDCSDPELQQIYSCINYGYVSNYNAGGIVGSAGSTAKIYECVNEGSVSPNAVGCPLGGITASIGGNTVVENCYNAGSLGSGTLVYQGGIAGGSSGLISKCYNRGYMPNGGNTSTNVQFPGAMLPMMGGTIRNCYYETLPGQVLIGTDKAASWMQVGDKSRIYESGGLSNSEMKNSASYRSWDFIGTWEIDKDYNYGYPILRSVKHMMTPTGQKTIKITVYDSSGAGKTPLKGAVIDNGETKVETNAKGVAKVTILTDNSAKVKVSCEGYITRTFTNKKFKKLSKVALVKASDAEPVFVRVEGINNVDKSTTDLLVDRWIVDKTNTEDFYIETEIKWPNDQVGEVYLEQGNVVQKINSNSCERFPMEIFDIDKTNPVYITAETESGIKTRKKMRVCDTSEVIEEELQKLFKTAGDALKPDVSFIDQLSTGVEIGPMQLQFKINNDLTYEVMLAVGDEIASAKGEENDDGKSWKEKKKEEFDEAYKEYKNLVKNCEKDGKYFGMGQTTKPFDNWTIEGSIVGYSEGIITYDAKKNIKLKPTENSSYLVLEGKIGDEYQCALASVPVVVGWEAALKGEFGSKIEFDSNNEALMGSLNVEVSMKGYSGVGFKKLVSAGAGGKVTGAAEWYSKSLLYDIYTQTSHLILNKDETKLSGQVYLYAKILGFKSELTLFKGTWAPLAEKKSILEKVESAYEPLSKAYLEEPSVLINEEEVVAYSIPDGTELDITEDGNDKQEVQEEASKSNVENIVTGESAIAEEALSEDTVPVITADEHKETSADIDADSQEITAEETASPESQEDTAEITVTEEKETDLNKIAVEEQGENAEETVQEAENPQVVQEVTEEVQRVQESSAVSKVATDGDINTVIANTYSDGRPQMVTLADGRRILVWVGESEMSAEGTTSSVILYSVHDGTSWSVPQMLGNDGSSNFSPSVTTDGTNVYVAWERMNRTLPGIGEIESAAAELEIATAVYDGNTFGEVKVLTSNSYIDCMPYIFTYGAETSVVWSANTANAILTGNSADDIYISSLKEGKWGAPVLLASKAGNILSMTGVYDENGVYTIFYNTDGDGDTSTLEDTDVWYIRDGSIVGIGAGNGEDTNLVASNTGKMYWKQGDTLACVANVAEPKIVTTQQLNDTIQGTFTIVDNANGAVKIIWPLGYTNADGALYTELQTMTYDTTSSTWGKAIEVTDMGYNLNEISAFMDEEGGVTVLSNIIKTITPTDDNMIGEGQCDIGLISLKEINDLKIGDKYFYDASKIVPGENLIVEFELTNAGTKSINGYTTEVYDSSNKLLTSEKTLRVITSGDMQNGSIGIPMNETEAVTDYIIKIVPQDGEDSNITDNILAVHIDMSSVDCEIVECTDEGADYLVRVKVENTGGYNTENAQVSLNSGNADGEEIQSMLVEGIAPGESDEVEFTVDKTAINFEDSAEALYAKCVLEGKEEVSSSDFTAVDNYNQENPCTAFVTKEDGSEVTISVVNNHNEIVNGKLQMTIDGKVTEEDIELQPFEGTEVILPITEANHGPIMVQVVNSTGEAISDTDTMWSEVEVEDFTLNQSSVKVSLDKSVQLKVVKYYPENATSVVPVWRCKDSKIATVDKQGNVTGIAVGATEIQCTLGKITKNVSVVVEEKKIYTVTFNAAGGKTVKTQQVIEGEKATKVSTTRNKYKFLGWYMNGNKYNFDTPVTKDITLTAKWSGIKVTKITVTGASKKIAVGKKVTLKKKIAPSNATNTAVTWSSSNKRYATVSSKGVVTTKTAGRGKTVTITAKAKDGSGIKATYKIKIMKGIVKKITLKGSKTLKAGKKLKIKTTIKASKGANKVLTWTSSNKKYATVSSKGVVTAKKAGKGKTVTITAKATDGSGKKAKIKIKIK